MGSSCWRSIELRKGSSQRSWLLWCGCENDMNHLHHCCGIYSNALTVCYIILHVCSLYWCSPHHVHCTMFLLCKTVYAHCTEQCPKPKAIQCQAILVLMIAINAAVSWLHGAFLSQFKIRKNPTQLLRLLSYATWWQQCFWSDGMYPAPTSRTLHLQQTRWVAAMNKMVCIISSCFQDCQVLVSKDR